MQQLHLYAVQLEQSRTQVLKLLQARFQGLLHLTCPVKVPLPAEIIAGPLQWELQVEFPEQQDQCPGVQAAATLHLPEALRLQAAILLHPGAPATQVAAAHHQASATEAVPAAMAVDHQAALPAPAVAVADDSCISVITCC